METEPANFKAVTVPAVGGPDGRAHVHAEFINHETPGTEHDGFCFSAEAGEDTARAGAASLAERLGKTVITFREAEDGCFYGLIGRL